MKTVQHLETQLSRSRKAAVTVNEKLGAACRGEREKRCLSLSEVSRRMGVTRTMLYYLERGERRWTEEWVRKWREAL